MTVSPLCRVRVCESANASLTMFLHDHLGSQPFSQLWTSPENLSLYYLFGPHALGHSMVLFMIILVSPKKCFGRTYLFSLYLRVLFIQTTK